MIQLTDVCFSYPDKQVLNHMNLTLPDKGRVALMAPSGFGKTTLLRLLAGLLAPDSGAVTGLQGRKISFLFQEDRLLPWLSAGKNVALVSSPEEANKWLRALEIENAAQHPREMSGGMQRRVALARALAYGGDVLLLDEPFQGLDEELTGRVAARIRDAAPLIILSVHDRKEAELMNASILDLAAQTREKGGGAV